MMASTNISFDQIPATIRKPGKYFEFNTRLAVRTLPANIQRVLLIGQRLGARIDPATWQGGTLNDCISGGTYTGLATTNFQIKISTAAATDKFKWSDDGGATWSAEVSVTGSAQTLQDGVTVTFGATTGHALDDQWNFTAWPEPTVAKEVPTRVFSDDEAAVYFGYGSMVHLMARAAINAYAYLDLSICAVDDASGGPVAASGTVTIAGTATASGSVTLYIGNVDIEVGIESGDTAAEIATALNLEIAKYADLPLTAKVAAGVITVTAKNKGTIGNQINLSAENTALGVTATVVAMASGTVDPDIGDALTAIYPEDYTIIVCPFNDATTLGDLVDHLDSVSGPLEQRGAVGVFATTGTLAAATTLAGQINSGRVIGPFLRGTRSISYEVASAFAGVMASEEDPARPLNTLELKKIHAPAIADRLSRTEQESLLYNGVTPLEVGPGEKVQIVRAITTYIHNPEGVDDISLLDVTTIRTLDYVRAACRTRIVLRFPREKLSTKTPDKVRAELMDVLKSLEALEIVEEVDANADGLIVERDLQDPNRLDAKIPVDVVNGLHVFAGRIDLLL
jgi:phage tail sheath gpL-like